MRLAPLEPLTCALLAIDPGACTGCALFDVRGRLAWAGALDGDAPHGLMAPHVVLEVPDHNQGVPWLDLITLAVRGGVFAGRTGSPAIDLVQVCRWKGNLSKEQTHERARGALSAVELAVWDPLEQLPKSKRHNVFDAIALGLWRLKRVRLA